MQKFITVDPDTLRMKDRVMKMAACDYEVLIEGETGTGKETIAKAMIGKRTGPIRAINCAGMPRELIESELFGHVQGAFTGAIKHKNGMLTEAAGGIMFLDEVGELPLDIQAKLLRVIAEKTIRKVGGTVEEKISCKIVTATNKSLKKMVQEGLFRQDLYARLSTLEVHIKPLRERMCDVVPITESLVGGKAFLEKHRVELLQGALDLSLNVRSLLQYVIRFNVLGEL